MYHVTPDEAKIHLAELIEAALRGEEVVIGNGSSRAVQLVPVGAVRVRRRAGSAKGMISVSEDFDAPLADFEEYTR